MAINVIFNDINYKIEKFMKQKPQLYLKLIKWGRTNPTRFVEKILQVQLTDHQKYIFLSMWNASNICILASRASGKSFIIALYIMTRCILFPNYKVAIMSPNGRQSKLLLGKIEDIAKHRITTIRNKSNVFLNELQKSPNSDGFHHGEQDSLTLYNGSEVTTFNADPKKNVGVRCNCIVYDEAGKIPREVFELMDPFISVLQDFQTGEINQECFPEQMPNQRILLSSAESIDTELFDTYKRCALKMLAGDPEYFVVDLNCDMSLHPSMDGQPCSPLLSRKVIDDAMATNEIKAMREYYNKFDNNGAEDSIVRRSAIERNMEAYAPQFASEGKDEKFLICYDPATRADNSFVLICKYWKDEERGWMMQVVNGVNFLEKLSDGTKKIINKPQQVERLKKIMLDYNGFVFGVRDWENLQIMVDPGSGGGGTDIATYLLDDWYDRNNNLHFGIIDKKDEYLASEASKFPNARDVLHMPTASGNKVAMFAAVTDLVEQNLIMFPKGLDVHLEFEYDIENSDGSRGVKHVRASKEEIRAMTEIDLMITELCTLERQKTPNGHVVIKYPANIKNLHDDRAYCFALACWYLNSLRVADRMAKQKEENAWRKKYGAQDNLIRKNTTALNRNPFEGRNSNPFSNRGENPFG